MLRAKKTRARCGGEVAYHIAQAGNNYNVIVPPYLPYLEHLQTQCHNPAVLNPNSSPGSHWYGFLRDILHNSS